MNTMNSINLGYFPSRLVSLADSLLREAVQKRECNEGTCSTSARATAQTWTPAVDVSETVGSYQIAADLPDVSGADVKVVVQESVLSIKGERKASPEVEGAKSYVSERQFGTFQRNFSLPKDSDGEKVSATFKNGVLTVTVPKKEEVKPREVEVKVSSVEV